STSSMLRTIELIVGLPPMTQFDTAATPMLASFSDTPNLRPYVALVPDQALDEMNTAASPRAAEAAAVDFTAEDRAPGPARNDASWKRVRGADSDMPQPSTAFRTPYGQAATPATEDDD